MSSKGDWRAYDGEPNEPYAIMFHHFHQDDEKPYGQGSLPWSQATGTLKAYAGLMGGAPLFLATFQTKSMYIYVFTLCLIKESTIASTSPPTSTSRIPTHKGSERVARTHLGVKVGNPLFVRGGRRALEWGL